MFIDSTQLEKANRLLKNINGGMPKAVSRAMNRAISSARTQGVKTVCLEYVIRASDINSTISLSRASASQLTAKINSKGAPTPLIKFRARQNKKSLNVTVKRSGGGKIKNAFIATTKKGYRGVFIRTNGKKAYPIKQIHGPSIPQMFNNDKVIDAMETRAEEQFAVRLIHEAGILLKGGIK